MDTRLNHPRATVPLMLVLLLATASCTPGSGKVDGTPAGMHDGIMYGQGNIQFVIDNIPIYRTRMGMITPRPEAVSYLKQLREPVTLKIFLGSWCIDSQTHMPVLFRALQEADNRRITTVVIGLDRTKRDRDGLTGRYEIALTPTVVIEHEGVELGRMVEAPLQDAASDVVAILKATLGG